MDKQLVNFITCGCESSAPFWSLAEILLKVALSTINQSLNQIDNISGNLPTGRPFNVIGKNLG
jgi:hypothetical protein